MVKFPKYTETEKEVFEAFFKSENPNIRFVDEHDFKGKGTYISFCAFCSELNLHEVNLDELGDKILKLQCPKCNKYYEIRPSPIMISDKEG